MVKKHRSCIRNQRLYLKRGLHTWEFNVSSAWVNNISLPMKNFHRSSERKPAPLERARRIWRWRPAWPLLVQMWKHPSWRAGHYWRCDLPTGLNPTMSPTMPMVTTTSRTTRTKSTGMTQTNEKNPTRPTATTTSRQGYFRSFALMVQAKNQLYNYFDLPR